MGQRNHKRNLKILGCKWNSNTTCQFMGCRTSSAYRGHKECIHKKQALETVI